MPALPVINLHADNLSHDDRRCALGCDSGGDRFHIWVEIVAGRWQLQNDVLHCNSVASSGEPGYHAHRSLNAGAAKNQPIVKAMMDAAPRLFAEALAKENEARRARNAKIAEEQAAYRVREAGPELLRILVSAIAQLDTRVDPAQVAQQIRGALDALKLPG